MNIDTILNAEIIPDGIDAANGCYTFERDGDCFRFRYTEGEEGDRVDVGSTFGSIESAIAEAIKDASEDITIDEFRDRAIEQLTALLDDEDHETLNLYLVDNLLAGTEYFSGGLNSMVVAARNEQHARGIARGEVKSDHVRSGEVHEHEWAVTLLGTFTPTPGLNKERARVLHTETIYL